MTRAALREWGTRVLDMVLLIFAAVAMAGAVPGVDVGAGSGFAGLIIWLMVRSVWFLLLVEGVCDGEDGRR